LRIIIPHEMKVPSYPGVSYYRSDAVDMLFTLYSNYLYYSKRVKMEDVIHPSAIIDTSASIGSEGIKCANYKGERVHFRHHGNVVIEENVWIGANAVVQCGSIDSTVIGRNTVISSLVVVGHNVHIGENCTLAIQAGISGSTRIGNGCWIGIGAIVRNNVFICDDVQIGMGGVVTKDITIPGVYLGNPCKFIRSI